MKGVRTGDEKTSSSSGDSMGIVCRLTEVGERIGMEALYTGALAGVL